MQLSMWTIFNYYNIDYTVVNHIPTTPAILTTCVVGIPLLMINKNEY